MYLVFADHRVGGVLGGLPTCSGLGLGGIFLCLEEPLQSFNVVNEKIPIREIVEDPE